MGNYDGYQKLFYFTVSLPIPAPKYPFLHYFREVPHIYFYRVTPIKHLFDFPDCAMWSQSIFVTPGRLVFQASSNASSMVLFRLR